MNDWLIDLSIDWLINWLIEWLIDGRTEIFPGFNANEIQITYDSITKCPHWQNVTETHNSVKREYENSNNLTKYEVLIKQHLRSILDISGQTNRQIRREFLIKVIP